MLIDSTHKRWILVTLIVASLSLGLYLFMYRLSPDGLKGGDRPGLVYGVLGTMMMIYAGLLAGHRYVPKWHWLGGRKVWLKGHIWIGLLSALFILCHSGFSWGGPLEVMLWITFLAVLITGILGLGMQQILPRLMTSRVPTEAPYEQIPHLCKVMREKADELMDKLCGPYDPRGPSLQNTMAVMKYRGDAKAQLRDFYEHDLRPFFTPDISRSSPMLNPIQVEARFTKLRNLPGIEEMAEDVEKLYALTEERRLLWEQERLHFWLHSWLLIHVPLCIALLILGVLHIVTALYY